ncbi:hypothetical protein HQ520_15150 [bacterium]|nr:hypothetical protein [bacterium]
MMNGRIGKPLDFTEVRTYSGRERGGALDLTRIARPPDVRRPLDEFYASLPRTGYARDLIEAAEHIVVGAANGRKIVWLIGPSVIEKGLGPLLVALMERNVVQHVAMDGTSAVLDFEQAFFGHTSDEADLRDGLFEMNRESAEWMNSIINDGARRGFGIGYSLGRGILDRRAPHDAYSILANAAGFRVPLTVHSAIGQEPIHQHHTADGSLIGKGSYKDFQFFAGQIPDIHHGGVVVDLLASDFLPEVFLRGLNVARNLGNPVQNFVTVRLAHQARVVGERDSLALATRDGGKTYCFPGPPELLFPLLFGAIQRLLR